ncbi:putative ABC transport system ATP-binding protein [Bradyrhizobium sp. USDA 4341]
MMYIRRLRNEPTPGGGDSALDRGVAAQFASEASIRRQPIGATTLETVRLSRKSGDRVLVRDVSMKAMAGEILAIVGPSGAGKSSLLRLLNRLDEPTSGTVLLNGKDYRSIAPQCLRRRVGMVMQTAYLFPGTVADNIAFGPRQRGEALAPTRIAALLERVGLPGFSDRHVSNLSGGEAQRIALARMLANQPEALLLDEPTSALDEASVRGIEELILGIVRERRMTCVIVTHNRAQAMRLAERTMVMERGRLAAIGPTHEVLHAG